jgi:hypothetical protein
MNEQPLNEEEQFLRELDKHAGEGISKRLEDNTLPLIRLLQTNSPEVDRRQPAYVEGASAGDWYFRDAPEQIVRGEVGFLFQPLYSQHAFVEWKPERQGFSGRTYDYFDPPPEAKRRMDPNPETGELREVLGLPNGNFLEETFYFYGLVGRFTWVISFRSTGLTVARRFNKALQFLEYKERPLPIWGSIWRISTVASSNKRGDWYLPSYALHAKVGGVDGVQPLTLGTFTKGKELRQQLTQDLGSGAKVLEAIGMEPAAPAPAAPTKEALGDDIPF